MKRHALPRHQQTHALHVDQKPVLLLLLLHENPAVFLKRRRVSLRMPLLFLDHNHCCENVVFGCRLGEKRKTAASIVSLRLAFDSPATIISDADTPRGR